MTGVGQLLSTPDPAQVWTGVVSAIDPFTVRAGETDIPCTQVGPWAPLVGDPAIVINSGGRAFAWGPIWPWARPDVVTVTSVTATTPDAQGDAVLLPGRITATDGVHEYQLRYLPSYTPNVDDVVSVSWASSVGVAQDLLSAGVGKTPSPPPPPSGSGVAYFRPLDAASWRGGWRTDRDDVMQGDSGGYGQNSGYFFYGGQISSALSGATVTAARIRLNRARGGANYQPPGEVVRLWRHTASSRPPSEPSRDIGPQDVRAPLGAAWYPLDLAIAQALTGGGGVAIAGGPYAVLESITPGSGDPESGLLEITWSR